LDFTVLTYELKLGLVREKT